MEEIPGRSGGAESRPRNLAESWQRLAPAVEDSILYRYEVVKYPDHWSDPWAATHVKWLISFEPEIAAIQTIYEAQRRGIEISVATVDAAKMAADTLFKTISKAREQVSY